MKVLILHDHVAQTARKEETDTLVQVQAICSAMETLGHEWMTLGLTLDLDTARIALDRLAPEVVFNVVESLGGFGRLIHVPCHLLDALEIPYTGASAEAMLLTSNKLLGKRMMQLAGVPTARWYTLDDLRQSHVNVPAGRYIIKSVWEHASIGLDEDSVIQAQDARTLREALESRLGRLGGEGFAEAYIDGREFNLGLLTRGGDRVEPEYLPPAEIDFAEYAAENIKVGGYRAKWDEESFEYSHTPPLYDFAPHDQPLIDTLRSIALQCWRLFDLRGHARVDFRVDQQGRPWVLEVNANPCLSPDAGFQLALHHRGVAFEQAVARILKDVPEKCRDAVETKQEMQLE